MTNLLTKVDAKIKIAKELNPIMAMGMLQIRKMIVDGDRDTISFHRLNGLKPTTISCTFKVLEELGEFVQLIGKHSGLSGETPIICEEVRIRRMVLESLDVAQAAITMAHTLCELHELSLGSFVESHERKLRQKGYLVEKKPSIPKIDPTWKVCENCKNQPSLNEIPEICERCEDNEWGRPSEFMRKKDKP